jgi:flagellar L-ring protein precursor FlgH
MKVQGYFLLMMLAAGAASADSVFNEASYRPLTSDHRSHRIGDILNVLIYETATASTSAKTDTNRSTGVGVTASDGFKKIEGDLGIKNDFEGGGTSNQTGKLVASISVTIQRILDNGDLIVSGEQYIELNNDSQLISVRGRARPEDVTTDNAILSSRLADSQIKFVGEGLLNGRSKPGLITRFFNWLF